MYTDYRYSKDFPFQNDQEHTQNCTGDGGWAQREGLAEGGFRACKARGAAMPLTLAKNCDRDRQFGCIWDIIRLAEAWSLLGTQRARATIFEVSSPRGAPPTSNVYQISQFVMINAAT